MRTTGRTSRCVLAAALALSAGVHATDAAPSGLWALEPVTDPPSPPVRDREWPRGALDAFVLAELEAHGLQPAPAAPRRTWIRRVTFDLTGLPPTPDEVRRFLADVSPGAFSRVVDRLLASPGYGERWGRHWLDIARYADSNGLDENIAHGNGWRYRDYVIASFNRDKPYDRFVIEQIAGDLLPPPGNHQAASSHEQLIATGFLSLGPKVLAESDQTKMEMDIIDEQIDTLGRSLLGLTFGCARCHDHKFDPIPIEDYYALAGIFKSTRTMESFKRIARWHEHPLATREELAKKAAHDDAIAAKEAEIKKLEEATEASAAGDPARKSLERARTELETLKKNSPELPSAMGVADGDVVDLRVHVRGSHLSLGEIVKRGFPSALTTGSTPAIDPSRSGRLALARWIASADHPLTARVLVNRLWRWHFGEGLVSTPDNFGTRGVPPRNRALLDWLASRLVEDGWSIKSMHRRMLLSSTYRMGSSYDEDAARVDPENTLLWRMNVRRLEAEAIRDSLLAVSGELDRTLGGSLLHHVKNRAFLFDHTSRDETVYESARRSVYLPVIRNHVYDVLALFDFPDPAVPDGDRSTTTVAPQALFLLNGELVARLSSSLAGRLIERFGGTNGEGSERRLAHLYLSAYGRPPTVGEIELALSFLERFAAEGGEHEAWAALCQVVLAANEFLFVR